MNKTPSRIENISRGIGQRLYYIKHLDKGFNFSFLLPGSIRERYLGEHAFFRTVTDHNPAISLTKDGPYSILKAGDYTFKFPKHCFYEGDFFDIIYPNLHMKDERIDTFVYKNPYYISEGKYEDFGAVLKEGDYVIDAGANIGTFSVMASRNVGATGKVFAFEPLTEISDVLKENAATNKCSNITVENLLLGETRKTVEFFYNLDANFNASSKTFKNEGDKVAHLTQVTLDEYVKDNNIEKIDFIKADIEGAERDLLQGAEETIRRFKPKLAIRTYHLPDDPEVLEGIVTHLVPEYNIKHHKKTLYAWI